MAESNFSIFGSTATEVRRGVTAGFTPPNGGDNFVFGFNSAVASEASVGLVYNSNSLDDYPSAGFYPLRDKDGYATGGSVRAAVKRGTSASSIGYSAGIFCCLQAATQDDTGYLLGLSNNDPSAIVLAKTNLSAGLDSTSTLALETSTSTVPIDTWAHLRLDVIVNPNGDVVLKCFHNDLDSHTVALPTWEAITGISDFIDDALGINSGSNPLAGGYLGFFFSSEYSETRGFIDHFEAGVQL